ncbi:F-box protein CPR1-like isoform X2 [Prosopis cineraria]|uniref:F-box protein CPR1-like isoform X2 n=1 Tax=Prosopis cineraria TaxID=364024 RepID=UPI00240FEC29|nr:F-box protein CPR1-like isoform X2 [Prosopis cineraria]
MREFRILPDFSAPPRSYCRKHYPGFVFDPITNDYEVVMIVEETDHEQLHWRVEIYALSSDCWRIVDCPLPHVSIWNGSWMDAFVHGAFHWLAYDAAGNLIRAFDMMSQTFRKIRQPNVRSYTQEYTGTVAKFRESIAVIVYASSGTEKIFDLWMMEDYSNEGSWTKHPTIGPIVGEERPLGFLEGKNLFLLEIEYGSMMSYDLQTEEIRYRGFRCGYGDEIGSIQVAVCSESLIHCQEIIKMKTPKQECLSLVLISNVIISASSFYEIKEDQIFYVDVHTWESSCNGP